MAVGDLLDRPGEARASQERRFHRLQSPPPMADLLECLVQIHALAESPGRLAVLFGGSDESAWRRRDAEGGLTPLVRLASLAEGELFFAVQLRLVLMAEEPLLPFVAAGYLARRAGTQAWSPTVALERFRARRADTVELLASCNAAELARTGRHPERGLTSVADIVALMLASDTESLGAIRAALAAGAPDHQGDPR
jgi:hypothetical protein